MKKLAKLGLLFALSLSVLAGCGGSKDNRTIVVYDGHYSEMQIIYRMIKYLVEDQTDLKIKIKDEMSSSVFAFRALIQGGDSDLMLSYDGSLLSSYLKLDVKDVPAGMSIYDYTNEVALERHQIYHLEKLGFENTYAIGVMEKTMQKYNLKTISDLRPYAGELIFGAEHEFFSEEGSMRFGPWSKAYNLTFKDKKPMNIDLKHTAIQNEQIDVMMAWTTDGMNKKIDLKLLEDDLQYFPDYNAAILVRVDLFERFPDVPELKDILNSLAHRFTNESMTDLVYEVDVLGKTPEAVALKFLQEQNLMD